MQKIITSLMTALLLAGFFTSVEAQERYSPQPLVIVADDLTPLDEGPLAHLDGLVAGGGFALDNTALIVNGAEVRRLGFQMPLAPKLMFYIGRGLSVFVCKTALAEQQALDGMPLVPGLRMLPDSSLPSDIARRFNAYCYTQPQSE